MKENLKCHMCHADYYVEWFVDRAAEYNNYVDPDYCPFCGTSDIEFDEDEDLEE